VNARIKKFRILTRYKLTEIPSLEYYTLIACGLSNKNYKPFYDCDADSSKNIYNEYKEMKINIPHFSITTTSNIPSPTEEQLHLMVSDPQNPIFGPLSSLDRKNAGNNEKNNESEVDNEDDNEDDNGEEYNSPNIVQQPTARKLAVENNRRIRASLFIRDITNEFNSNVKITQPNLRELGKQLGVPIEDKILLKSLILRELENYDINTPNNPEIILTNLKNISISK